ncbi:MAG: hypothetical protein R3E21_07810 [Caenibius sp.]
MGQLWKQAVALAAFTLMATPAHAASDSTHLLAPAVFVERQGAPGMGNSRSIEPAGLLQRGDTVVLFIPWQAPAPARAFTLTVPVPARLAFLKSTDRDQKISVDGGRTWGQLGQLTIRDGDSLRLASPADATHLRWQISARDAAQGSGRIMLRALVR